MIKQANCSCIYIYIYCWEKKTFHWIGKNFNRGLEELRGSSICYKRTENPVEVPPKEELPVKLFLHVDRIIQHQMWRKCRGQMKLSRSKGQSQPIKIQEESQSMNETINCLGGFRSWKGQLFSQMLEWFRTASQLDWVSCDHFWSTGACSESSRLLLITMRTTVFVLRFLTKLILGLGKTSKQCSHKQIHAHQNLRPASHHFQISQLGRTLFLPVLILLCTRIVQEDHKLQHLLSTTRMLRNQLIPTCKL